MIYLLQSAITFLTPAYERVIHQPIDVYVELRKSDGETSEAWPFKIYPEDLNGSIPLKRAQQTFREINDSLHSTNICCKYFFCLFSLLISFANFCQSMYPKILHTHLQSVFLFYIRVKYPTIYLYTVYIFLSKK